MTQNYTNCLKETAGRKLTVTNEFEKLTKLTIHSRFCYSLLLSNFGRYTCAMNISTSVS